MSRLCEKIKKMPSNVDKKKYALAYKINIDKLVNQININKLGNQIKKLIPFLQKRYSVQLTIVSFSIGRVADDFINNKFSVVFEGYKV